MLHRFIVEALDITLRDLMQSDEPFGSKVIVCGGDFRQTLPVVPRASRQQILDACLTRSRLWQHFQQHRLVENMRVRMAASEGHEDADELQAFAEWLLRLGNGTEPHDELDTIDLPADLCQPEGADVDALVAWVYPELEANCTDPRWLAARAILTPLNATVDAINAQVTEAFPGEAVELLSADVASEADAVAVTEEMLNTLRVPNFPAHELRLKPRMPLMLLRNISPPDGLCNGTRLIFHRVIGRTGGRQLLECEIASGSEHVGDIVYLPRLTLDADDSDFPFKWSRRQFPVRRTSLPRPAARSSHTRRVAGAPRLRDDREQGAGADLAARRRLSARPVLHVKHIYPAENIYTLPNTYTPSNVHPLNRRCAPYCRSVARTASIPQTLKPLANRAPSLHPCSGERVNPIGPDNGRERLEGAA